MRKINLTEKLALDLLVIADMYCVAELKEECDIYLSKYMKSTNLLKIIKVVETAESEILEDKIVNFLHRNLEELNKGIDLESIPPHLLVKCMLKMNGALKEIS